MRFIELTVMALCFLLLLPGQSAPVFAGGEMGLQHYIGAELVEHQVDSEGATHLVVLGALEKVNHELEPEASDIVAGLKSSATYYLPQARRTKDVFQHYLPQLAAMGDIVFQCRGRTCGSSSNWANKILDRAILYGPEQFQYYVAVRLPDEQGYLYVYIGQRATRKIYVHTEQVLREKVN